MKKFPWYTSNRLIESVKRRISFPLAQETFDENDILAFANEEMLSSEVPSVLSYHEEFYVFRKEVPLLTNQIRYPIPDRALGMRLRGIFHKDTNGNYYELTRVMAEDKAYFQTNIGSSHLLTKYYLEGNDIVLTQTQLINPSGTLIFFFFIRPNQLVVDDRASTIASFTKEVSLIGQPSAGDTIVINNVTFTAVSSSPGDYEFLIGANVNATTTNLKTVLDDNLDAISVDSIDILISTLTFHYTNRQLTFVSGSNNIEVSTTLGIIFDDTGMSLALTSYTDENDITTTNYISTTGTTTSSSTEITDVANTIGLLIGTVVSGTGIPDGATVTAIDESTVTISDAATASGTVTIQFGSGEAPKIDFLQTLPGHQIRGYSVDILEGGYQDNSLLVLDADVPTTLVVGDYLAVENEAIIPFLPPELHTVLAEKVAGRLLAAIGDQQGVAISAAKLQEMKSSEGTLIDNRVDGNPAKITGRKSILRFQKMRNFYPR